MKQCPANKYQLRLRFAEYLPCARNGHQPFNNNYVQLITIPQGRSYYFYHYTSERTETRLHSSRVTDRRHSPGNLTLKLYFQLLCYSYSWEGAPLMVENIHMAYKIWMEISLYRFSLEKSSSLRAVSISLCCSMILGNFTRIYDTLKKKVCVVVNNTCWKQQSVLCFDWIYILSLFYSKIIHGVPTGWGAINLLSKHCFWSEELHSI